MLVGIFFSLNDFFLMSSWCSDKEAINRLSPGDAVIVFTPDSKWLFFLAVIRCSTAF
jgi:hypothetical protein